MSRLLTMLSVWTYQDFLDGLCDRNDVGEQKPLPDPSLCTVSGHAGSDATGNPVIIDPIDPKQLFTERLEKDLQAAYVELGGKEYLKRNPELVNKLLAKQVPTPPSPPQNKLHETYPALSWVSARRLLYKEMLKGAEDIESKPALDQPTSSSDPTP